MCFVWYRYVDPRDRLFLPHAVPTRRSSSLRRLIALIAFAKAEPQHSYTVDHDTAAVMVAAAGLALLAEQHGDSLEAVASQPRRRQRGAGTSVAGFGIGEIDPAVAGEIREIGRAHV